MTPGDRGQPQIEASKRLDGIGGISISIVITVMTRDRDRKSADARFYLRCIPSGKPQRENYLTSGIRQRKRILFLSFGARGGPPGRGRESGMPCMSATSYPPTDCTAVLSAMAGLTAEFGMGSGDPCLHGRAHAGHWPQHENMQFSMPARP